MTAPIRGGTGARHPRGTLPAVTGLAIARTAATALLAALVGTAAADPLAGVRFPGVLLDGREPALVASLEGDQADRVAALVSAFDSPGGGDLETRLRSLIPASGTIEGVPFAVAARLSALLAALLAQRDDEAGSIGLVTANLTRARQAEGEAGEATAEAYRSASRCRLLLSQGEVAVGLARRALELDLRHRGAESASFARSRLALASALASSGRLPEALEGFEDALRGLERNLGSDSPEVARALLHWAPALASADRLDEALLSLGRAELLLGGEHQERSGALLAPRWIRLGILVDRGRLDAAMETAESFLGLLRESGHPPPAEVLGALSALALEAGWPRLAEEWARSSLASASAASASGPVTAPADTEDPGRAAHRRLGAVLLAHGEFAAARRELVSARPDLDPRSMRFEPAALAVCFDLGELDFLEGRLEAGIGNLEACLRPRIPRRGPAVHPPGRQSGDARLRLARMRSLLGDLAGADRDLATAAILRRRHGSPAPGETDLALATARAEDRSRRQGPRAAEALAEALDRLGPGSPSSPLVAEARFLLLASRLERGDTRGAARLYPGAREAADRTRSGSLTSIRLRQIEAWTAALAGRDSLALRGAEEALQGILGTFGADNPASLPDRCRIAEVLRRSGDPEAAARALEPWDRLSAGYRPESPILLRAREERALQALAAGRGEEAVRELEAALQVAASSHGPEGWPTARLGAARALALAATGSEDRARHEARTARRLLAAELEPGHPDLAALGRLAERPLAPGRTTRVPRSGP